jgi:hypothetical protein
MPQKLTEKDILEKYPKIFRQKDLSMQQTCMCWGLECNSGWYPLIDKLCEMLQWDIDNNEYPQIEATQVKEKFGTLRFYYSTLESKEKHKVFVWKGWSYLFKKYSYSFRNLSWTGRISLGCFDLQLIDVNSIRHWEAQQTMISVAEQLSAEVCEQCGSIEEVSQTKGWIVTLCKKCKTKYNKKRGIKEDAPEQ